MMLNPVDMSNIKWTFNPSNRVTFNNEKSQFL